MRDLNDKITGGTLTADEWNDVPSEIQNMIESSGLVLSGADLSQLSKGIASYSASGNYYSDTGSANAYVLSTVAPKLGVPAYIVGATFRFIPTATNTGASTANINGLGVLSIKLADGVSDPAAGDILAGTELSLVYKSTYFELVSNVATQTAAGKAEIATQAEVNAGAVDGKFVSPLKMRFGFSILLATNGYVALPSWLGGVVLQWGTTTSAVGGDAAIAFPLVFPNAVYGIVATYFGGGAPSLLAATTTTILNTSGSNIYARNTAGATVTSAVYYWWAFGY